MIRIFFSMIILLGASAFANEKPIIIVSVAPYKWVIEQIAGDAVDVFLIVPPGASAHTFEPSPKDMMKASRASLWFTLGETFEKKAIGAISANHPAFKTVDLTQGVNLIQCDPLNGCACHHPGSADLHLWLSPRELKIQAATIGKALNQLLPDHHFSIVPIGEELDRLDQQIREIVKAKKNPLILVSHPAFGYFCRDYGFIQKSIEVEGKEPTPRRLNDLIQLAKSSGIKKVFAEPQYSDKAAKLIAEQLNATIVMVDPYSENVVGNMLYIAKEFAND